MDIAEFILKMFTIGFFIAGILGMILQTINFSGQVHMHESLRVATDLAHAAAAAPCLAETVGGDVRKGVIDSQKFTDAEKNFCLKLYRSYRLKIINSTNHLLFSSGALIGSGTKIAQPLPVLVKSGSKYTGGVIDVEVG